MDVSDPSVMFDTPEGSSYSQESLLTQSRSGVRSEEVQGKGIRLGGEYFMISDPRCIPLPSSASWEREASGSSGNKRGMGSIMLQQEQGQRPPHSKRHRVGCGHLKINSASSVLYPVSLPSAKSLKCITSFVGGMA